MSRSYQLARIALILAILTPVYFAIAALGTKFGLWSWQFGLGTLTAQGGPILLGIVALLALIALVWCLAKPPRKGWALALAALAVPVLAFVTLGGMRDRAGSNPIHDVSTDANDPPSFSQGVVEARAAAEMNPIRNYGEPIGDGGLPEVAEETYTSLIPQLYPDLDPIVVAQPPEEVLPKVQAAMMEFGLSDVTAMPQDGRVEGVAETFWFGFEDDVVARVRGIDEGTRIDFRSVSRVGLSDLGANADRIRALRAAVASRLSSGS